jgi:hypothetical protein
LGENEQTLKNLLRKKILKIVPVWMIAIMVLVPTVAAATLFLSNRINQSVTVVAMPIAITNGLDANMISGSPYSNTLPYTISSSAVGVSSLTSGFLQIVVSGTGSSPQVGFGTITVAPNLGGSATLVLASSNEFSYTKVFYYGLSSTTAFNFGSSNSVSGSISISSQVDNAPPYSFSIQIAVVPSLPS